MTLKMCLKWDLRLVEILAFLNRSGEGSFHPDGINHFTLPNEWNCQLFLSLWAILLPPIALGREI